MWSVLRVVVILATISLLLVGCSVSVVDHYRLYTDLARYYQSGKNDSLPVDGKVYGEFIPAEWWGDIIVVHRTEPGGEVRFSFGDYTIETTSIDAETRSQRVDLIMSRRSNKDSLSLYRGMNRLEIDSSLAPEGVLVSQRSKAAEPIPLWLVESIIAVEEQAAYEGSKTQRSDAYYIARFEHDLERALLADSDNLFPITGLTVDQIDTDLSKYQSIHIAYRDSLGSPLVIVSGRYRGLQDDTAESSSLESRMAQIVQRTKVRTPLDPFRGLPDSMLIRQVRSNQLITFDLPQSVLYKIPLWKTEAVVSAEDQEAYGIAKPMSGWLPILAIAGIGLGLLLFYEMLSEISEFDIYGS